MASHATRASHVVCGETFLVEMSVREVHDALWVRHEFAALLPSSKDVEASEWAKLDDGRLQRDVTLCTDAHGDVQDAELRAIGFAGPCKWVVEETCDMRGTDAGELVHVHVDDVVHVKVADGREYLVELEWAVEDHREDESKVRVMVKSDDARDDTSAEGRVYSALCHLISLRCADGVKAYLNSTVHRAAQEPEAPCEGEGEGEGEAGEGAAAAAAVEEIEVEEEVVEMVEEEVEEMVDVPLRERFDFGVTFVQNLPPSGSYTPGRDEKLQFYSLYKQATVGDVNKKRPGVFDVVGRAKWDAWKGKEGMSAAEAMQSYVSALGTMATKFPAGTPERRELEEKLKAQRTATRTVMTPKRTMRKRVVQRPVPTPPFSPIKPKSASTGGGAAGAESGEEGEGEKEEEEEAAARAVASSVVVVGAPDDEEGDTWFDAPNESVLLDELHAQHMEAMEARYKDLVDEMRELRALVERTSSHVDALQQASTRTDGTLGQCSRALDALQREAAVPLVATTPSRMVPLEALGWVAVGAVTASVAFLLGSRRRK